MAGEGKRFIDGGYQLPKPFIDVNGKPMIRRVLDNLKIKDARYILLSRNEHLLNYQSYFDEIVTDPNVKVISIDSLTEGAAMTSLFAFDQINNNYPLLIANIDQIVDIDVEEFISDAINRRLKGSILVFESNDPKWSYVQVDNDGWFKKLKEKEVISNLATVGMYFFSSGKEYIKFAIEMIIRNDRTKNEFYIAPIYNYIHKIYPNSIRVYKIEKSKMHGIGTPKDLENYLTKVHSHEQI
jgi:dTDP-glucose pyrophosphorylase